MQFAVVLPTFNERENISRILARLSAALHGFTWEAIFVDDDSPDGTAEVIAAHAQSLPNVRLIHRVGRRGLASACIEGMLATDAPFIAVMDADLQHDETILPEMFSRLQQDALDIVVGTRNAAGGSMGRFGPARVLLSRLGRTVSRGVCHCDLSDPMSGFFMVRREYLLEVVHDLQAEGFKVLVDLLAAARRPVRCGEVGFTFGVRRYGKSKLNMLVGLEYVHMIVSKRFGNILPMQRMLSFCAGGLGLLAYLVAMFIATRFCHVYFMAAQLMATAVALAENVLFTNLTLFRHQRLHGARWVQGASYLLLACLLGAGANLIFAHALWRDGIRWYLAGFGGVLLGSTSNLLVSSLFVWPMQTSVPTSMPISIKDPRRTAERLVRNPEISR